MQHLYLRAVDVAAVTCWVSHAECRVPTVISHFMLSWRGGDTSHSLSPCSASPGLWRWWAADQWSLGRGPGALLQSVLRFATSQGCALSEVLFPPGTQCPDPSLAWELSCMCWEVRSKRSPWKHKRLHLTRQTMEYLGQLLQKSSSFFFLRLRIQRNIYILFSKQSLREI